MGQAPAGGDYPCARQSMLTNMPPPRLLFVFGEDCSRPACEWIRILWRCRQDRKPYDEAGRLIALKEKGSPLVKERASQWLFPDGLAQGVLCSCYS